MYFHGFGRFDRHHRFSFFGGLSHHFVGLRDAHHFFDGGSALRHASPTVLTQRFHPFGYGALLELTAVALLHDQLAKRLGDQTNFIDRGAPLISSLPALITTYAPLELRAVFLYGKADLGQIFARVINQLGALRTDCAYQPLRDEGFHH